MKGYELQCTEHLDWDKTIEFDGFTQKDVCVVVVNTNDK